MIVTCAIALLVWLCCPFKAWAQPVISACQTAIGTNAVTITVSSGQSLIAFYSGAGSGAADPGVTDGTNTWVAPTCSPSVNSASNGSENFRYVLAPATGSTTVTSGYSSTTDHITVCTVTSLGSVDVCGGKATTAGATAQSGTLTPSATSELVVSDFFATGASLMWSGASSNYSTSTNTTTDVSLGGTTSNSTQLTGLSTEASATSLTGIQRTFTVGSGGSNGAKGLGMW